MSQLVAEDKPATATPEETDSPTPETLIAEVAAKADEGETPDEPAADSPETPKGDKPEKPDPVEKPVGEPEGFENLTLGEGSPFDETHLDSVRALAAELGVNAENAQLLLERDEKLIEAYADLAKAEVQAQSARWMKELEAHETLGGKHLPDTKRNLNTALSLAPEAFTKGLLESGKANWPPLVEFLNTIGAGMSESLSLFNGSTPGATGPSAKTMYPNSPEMHDD